MKGPAIEFRESVVANIAYWRSRLSDNDDQRNIDDDRANLYRAIEFGLGLQDTWHDTAGLIIECLSLIVQKGYYREWIPVVERAVASCQEEDLALKGRLLDQLGLYYRRNRQLDDAIAAHLEEEQIGVKLGDSSRKAFARMQLSAAYWRKRQHETAQRYGLAALDGFSRLDASEERIASCHINLGNIAQAEGDLDKAKEHLVEAVALYRELNQPVDLATALKNLSTVFEMDGNYDEALLVLIDAADILAPTGFEIDKATVEINIGTLYFRKGRYDLAEAAFKRADSPFMREMGPAFYRALTANNLGNIYLVREEWDRAENYLLEAVQLFNQAQSRINLANSLSGVAEARVGKGDVEKAIIYYDQAIKIVSSYPEDAWAIRLLGEFNEARQLLLPDNHEKKANHHDEKAGLADA